MVYKWATGSRMKVSAQVAGTECERLSRDGRLTPGNLVDESRPEGAPLHDEFEWDDTVAAEEYRKDQARHIIRSIVVVKDERKPTRAFFPVTVTVDRPSPARYERVEVIMADASMRQSLLDRAMAELSAFKRKYESLAELSKLFEAIDRLVLDV